MTVLAIIRPSGKELEARRGKIFTETQKDNGVHLVIVGLFEG